jgi:hypothetical protein
VKYARITYESTEAMSLIGTESWYSEVMFYIEGKFWLDDFKWFSGGATFYDSIDTGIYIFLSYIIAYLSLIILFDREGFIVFTMIAGNLVVLFPFVSI